MIRILQEPLRYVLAIFAVLGPLTSSVAIARDAPAPFKVSLTLSRDVLLPYEPVTALVEATNISDQPQSLTGPVFGGRVSIRRGKKGRWHSYTVDARHPGPQAAAPVASRKIYQPGDGVTTVISVDMQGSKNVFADPGIYWIKGQFFSYESNPEKIRVQQPNEVDAKAYQYLQKHPLYWWFVPSNAYFYMKYHDPSRNRNTTASLIRRLRAFSQRFPKSRYAAWAELGALFVKQGHANIACRKLMHGLEKRLRRKTKKEKESIITHFATRIDHCRNELKTTLKELETLAPKLVPAAQVECKIAAGVIAMRLQERDVATKKFKEAIAARRIQITRQRAQKLLNNYELLKIRWPRAKAGTSENEGTRKNALPPLSKRELDKVKEFIHTFADAVETRKAQKLRPFYTKGKRGKQLAERTLDEFKELKSGKLHVSFTDIRVHPTKSAHYRVTTRMTDSVDGQIYLHDALIVFEVERKKGEWQILSLRAGDKSQNTRNATERNEGRNSTPK